MEELILIAEDSPVVESIVPHDKPPKTIARIEFEILNEYPYQYFESELFIEVHINKRKRPDLKIDSCNIKRSPLLQKCGWGIHRNQEGKLALVAVNSEEYIHLSKTIKTTRSYRNKKIKQG
jgi:hypothetical protein